MYSSSSTYSEAGKTSISLIRFNSSSHKVDQWPGLEQKIFITVGACDPCAVTIFSFSSNWTSRTFLCEFHFPIHIPYVILHKQINSFVSDERSCWTSRSKSFLINDSIENNLFGTVTVEDGFGKQEVHKNPCRKIHVKESMIFAVLWTKD